MREASSRLCERFGRKKWTGVHGFAECCGAMRLCFLLYCACRESTEAMRRMVMRLNRTGSSLTALAGLATIGTVGLAMAATPPPSAMPVSATTLSATPASAPSAEGQAHWKLLENYCVKCHNTED